MSSFWNSHIEQTLADLENQDLYRQLRTVQGEQDTHIELADQRTLLLCSNNYLGLANHPTVKSAALTAIERYGTSAGASRLVSGNMQLHEELERELADFKGYDRSVLVGSGYLVNSGIIPALTKNTDSVIFSDELNHASIIDGTRLSGKPIFVYRHCDPEHLEFGLRKYSAKEAVIVTDSVFSMDGDIAPLPEICELAQRHGALTIVDEAHGTGTVGPGGRGAVAKYGLEERVDVLIGTLGKALGSYGAYICCNQRLANYLTNRLRSLIFSTGLPPAAAAAALAALRVLKAEPARVTQLSENGALIREQLTQAGLTIETAQTPIIPLVIGSADKTLTLSRQLLEHSIYVGAIRPPTVPRDSSRLRITVMATHQQEDLVAAAKTISRLALQGSAS